MKPRLDSGCKWPDIADTSGEGGTNPRFEGNTMLVIGGKIYYSLNRSRDAVQITGADLYSDPIYNIGKRGLQVAFLTIKNTRI